MCWIARQTSILQDGVRFLGGLLNNTLSLGCAGLARDPAKVEDQVRFLAGALSRRWSQTARQPAATRSKWVRLPPASPSDGMFAPNLHTALGVILIGTETTGD